MRTHPSNRSAFSLLELLAVILIIGIVSVFVTPAVSTILRGSQISQGEQILMDQLKGARQLALTRNRSIEVRFIRYGDPEVPGEKRNTPSSGLFRAIQILEVLDNGSILPIDKPQVLPPATAFNSSTLSTMISDSSMTLTQASQGRTNVNNVLAGGDPAMPRGVEWNYEFVAFRFLRDGSTDLRTTGATVWCVTLVNMNDKPSSATLPPNFVTVQVDPVSGALRIYRPSV